MTEFILDKSVEQAEALFDDFCQLMDRNKGIDFIESLETVNALAGVKSFPARIKSATLCWYTMYAALNGNKTTTTE